MRSTSAITGSRMIVHRLAIGASIIIHTIFRGAPIGTKHLRVRHRLTLSRWRGKWLSGSGLHRLIR